MKIAIVLLLVVVATVKLGDCVCTSGMRHDLEQGCKASQTSFLVLRTTVSSPALALNQANVQTLSYPQSGTGSKIGCIKIRNKRGDGCPSITGGGVGFKNVGLRFESQGGREMNFDVEIYAASF